MGAPPCFCQAEVVAKEGDSHAMLGKERKIGHFQGWGIRMEEHLSLASENIIKNIFPFPSKSKRVFKIIQLGTWM